MPRMVKSSAAHSACFGSTSLDNPMPSASDFGARVRYFLAGGLVILAVEHMVVDAAVTFIKGATASIVQYVPQVMPSTVVQRERRERIRELREESRHELWLSRNLTFEGDFSDSLKQVFRRHHREKAVLLDLQARRLEEGRLVRKYPPAKWYDNVFVYPMDLDPNDLPGLSTREANRKPIVVRNRITVRLGASS